MRCRGRPFNLGGKVFCFVQKIFFGQHKLEYFDFFRAKDLTLGYMTKTESHYFFSLHLNQNNFFSNIGNHRTFFLEKKHNPPFKLNGRSLKEALATILIKNKYMFWKLVNSF